MKASAGSDLMSTCQVLVCRGMAKRLKLPISGRRNAFGCYQGKRRCEWQSGTTPCFAVGFGSNTHTLPNWRLPPAPEIHALTGCRHKACQVDGSSGRDTKVISKLVQRAQRECTGYYCGQQSRRQCLLTLAFEFLFLCTLYLSH